MHLALYFFLTLTVLLNVLCAVLLISLLRRRKPVSKGLVWAAIGWEALMLATFAIRIVPNPAWEAFARQHLYLPMAVGMIWNTLLILIFLLGLLLANVTLRYLRPAHPASAPLLTGPEFSRRRFLYTLSAGTLPAVAVGMGVHGTLTEFDLRVRRYTIAIAGLAPELEGFTLAHLSDLHSGIFCGPRRLKMISDAANDLKADLVTVTGDLINQSMNEFDASLEALRRIESTYGIFACEGNHDILPGKGLVRRACAENQLPFLFGQTAILPVRGKRLLLAGLPWMGRHYRGTDLRLAELYPERQPGDLRVMMLHHPDFFDGVTNVDLVLSGHTHGGQLMFGPVGIGPLIFKYWSGLYARGDSQLIVSNGCGDWFPCRIGAPAEIGLIRLTAA